MFARILDPDTAERDQADHGWAVYSRDRRKARQKRREHPPAAEKRQRSPQAASGDSTACTEATPGPERRPARRETDGHRTRAEEGGGPVNDHGKPQDDP